MTNAGEWEYLDVFSTRRAEGGHVIDSPNKQAEKDIHIGTEEKNRGCRIKFQIGEGLKAFKITIYGEDIDPITEKYRLDWDGKNYDEIKMCRINQKETNNG